MYAASLRPLLRREAASLSASSRGFLLLFLLFSSVRACDTSLFDSVYASYPDCAATCMACPDASYTSNFAHTCDFASGACCTSQYHNAITQVWSNCVLNNCGQTVAQTAFNTFEQFCAGKGKPLAQADAPAGYVYNATASSSGSSNSTSSSNSNSGAGGPTFGPLTEAQFIGVIVSGVGALAGIISAYIAIRRCLRNRRAGPGRTDTETAVVRAGGGGGSSSSNRELIHSPPANRPWEMPDSLTAGAPMSFTRNTSTFSLTRGWNSTTETFHIMPDGRRVSEVRSSGMHIVEEVD